jgi:hypothetical protein
LAPIKFEIRGSITKEKMAQGNLARTPDVAVVIEGGRVVE